MAKLLVFFLIIFATISALMFGYRHIRKVDIITTGKLLFAALVSGALATVWFVIEVS